MELRKTYKIPIYNDKLEIILCDDITSLNASFNDLDMVKGDHAVTFARGTKLRIGIQMDKITPGTICHEAKHAVNMIFQDKGLTLDPNNDEAECYLLGIYR